VSLVLDSSATLAWIYSDETTEPIRQLFDTVVEEGAFVPALWRLEVANSLTLAMRKGRIDAGFRRASLADLALLDIMTDADTDFHAWTETLNLADSFQLTLSMPLTLSLRCAAGCRWRPWTGNCDRRGHAWRSPAWSAVSATWCLTTCPPLTFRTVLQSAYQSCVAVKFSFNAGRVAVVVAQAAVGGVAVDHGIHVAAGDAVEQRRPRQSGWEMMPTRKPCASKRRPMIAMPKLGWST
jgi:hypothetical protein